MTDAFIYDHVRTPRGRGRPDGSLHEISSVQLAQQVLRALADRNELDTSLIDDVIMGCAQPVGEQGGNIARAAVLLAGYAANRGRPAGASLLRLGARGGQCSRCSNHDRTAFRRHRRRRRIDVAHRDGRR